MADYRSLAANYARKYGLPVNIFLRQIQQESGFNPNARSRAGALGIAQFMPATARGMGVNPLNPASALEGAARMDAANLRKYGNWADVLSLYNSGRGWKQGQQIGETRNYVRSILGGAKGGGARQAALPPSPEGASPVDPRRQLALDLINAISARQRGEKADYLGMFQRFKQSQQQLPAQSVQMQLPSGGTTGAKEMETAVKAARAFGLNTTENPLVGQVNPVHVKNSYHYRSYPGTKIGRALDISGSPQQMAAFYRWAAKTYGGRLSELFYDPLGGIKNGKQIGAIGGHSSHVHIAF